MRTTPFDKLRTAKPVNKQAGMMFAGGIHWNPNHKGNPHARKWSDKPTDWLLPVPKDGHKKTFEDMTGRKLGRFTVVGWLGCPNPKKKGVWLVRCTCGNYETRGAKAIRNANPKDKCENCAYLERVKRGDGHPGPAQADTHAQRRDVEQARPARVGSAVRDSECAQTLSQRIYSWMK